MTNTSATRTGSGDGCDNCCAPQDYSSGAVSAALVEGTVLEKCLIRSLKNLEAADRDALGETLCSNDRIRQICENAFKNLTVKHLVPMFQKEIRDVVAARIVEFGKSEEFKDMIDSRFRLMEQYLRSDVIPKCVEKLVQS